MHLPVYYKAGSINYADYVTDGGILDLKRIRRELHEVSPVSIPDEIRKRFINVGVDLSSSSEETKRRATHLLDMINLLSISYPYSERSQIDSQSVKLASEPRRIEYDEKWRNDLISLNGYLSWLWQGRKDEILKLINTYKQIDQEEAIARLKAERERMLQAAKNAGQQLQEAELQEFLRPFSRIVNFDRIITDFFERVNIIQTNVIPQVKSLSYKLDIFQNKFEIKKYVVITLIFTFSMMVFGVFLPLFVHLNIQKPHIKVVEHVLLVVSLLPYFTVLLLFLKKALAIEFK
jgi:hypothetical protein